jgi:MFS family permease
MYGVRLSFGVFFKPMIYEFDWSRAMMSGAFSMSIIVQGLLGIVMGSLNDRLGPRVVLTLSGIFMGLGYLLLSQISAEWQFYLFYVVIIGAGMGGRWFVKRRSIMAGIVMAGLGAGTLIMAPVANWLISGYGWRNAYIILGAMIVVIVILAAQFLSNPKQNEQVLKIENRKEENELNSSDEGLSLKEAIHTRQLWMGFAAFFSLGFCLLTINVHIVPHVTDLGISATTAANILATVGGAGLVGGIVLGGTADKIGNRQGFAICFILMAVALVLLAFITKVWMIYLCVAFFGFLSGIAALQSPLVAELFGIKSHGLIFGFMNLGFTIGAAVGPFIAGYIFDAMAHYQLSFILCAVIGLMGFVLTVLLRPIKRFH